jgi:RNA polymerase sigma factor (sigma-70 family)
MRRLTSLTDEELLRLDDPDAFAAFYRRHVPLVVGYVLARLGDRELAADVVAEVFAAALTSRRSFDPERGAARAWLCTIAANKITDSRRRGRVEDDCRRSLSMAPILLDDLDLQRVDDLAAAYSLVGDQTALLAGLPEETRAAVAGRVIDEREYADLAAELRCSESVVRKRVSRGLSQLRTRLTEQ